LLGSVTAGIVSFPGALSTGKVLPCSDLSYTCTRKQVESGSLGILSPLSFFQSWVIIAKRFDITKISHYFAKRDKRDKIVPFVPFVPKGTKGTKGTKGQKGQKGQNCPFFGDKRDKRDKIVPFVPFCPFRFSSRISQNLDLWGV
jgi:hypothetical protein